MEAIVKTESSRSGSSQLAWSDLLPMTFRKLKPVNPSVTFFSLALRTGSQILPLAFVASITAPGMAPS